MKNCIILIILFSGQSLAIAQTLGLFPDVSVMESNDRGMTIEYRPVFMDDLTVESDNNSYSLPRFSHSTRIDDNAPGSEDIRGRAIQIAVPSFSGNRITVLAADYETVNNYQLAPNPTVEMIDDLGGLKKTYKAEYRSQQSFYPAAIAKLENPGSVKGWTTAQLILLPYQFQSANKSLRKYKRIVVRVDFGTRDHAFDMSGNTDWASASVLNYETARRWGGIRFQKATGTASVLSFGVWYKCAVTQDGMYKIDASYLRSAGIDVASLGSITDVKIFGSDGRKIPESLSAPRPADLPQMAVDYVDKNNNTKFDEDDYLLFYGQGTTGWTYDPVQKQFAHYLSPYTNSNYYFIAIGANVPVKRMAQKDIVQSAGPAVTATLGKKLFKEEKFNFNFSGQNWVSAPLNPNDSRVITTKLDGWMTGSPVRYVYQLYARSNANTTFTIEESGVQIASPIIFGMSEYALNSAEWNYAESVLGSVTAVPNLTDQRSALKLTCQSSSSITVGYIDWIRIFYQQQLTASNDQIMFTSPDTSGLVRYDMTGFSTSDIACFDVTDINNQQTIVHHLSQVVGITSFTDTNSVGTLKKYWTGTPAAYKTPSSPVPVPNSNLHGYSGAEFIVITHKDFIGEANRLKQHKESLPTPISTVVVDIDSIYNEFGMGMPDAVAMRDFIRYAYEHWTIVPQYVLFFGDATFDHKNILGNDRTWVPTIETPESNSKISTYNYEDFFSYMNPASPVTVSIAHGRLCPRSVEEARLLVDRIIAYEKKPVYSSWKNLITIVADDLWSTDSQNEVFNTDDSERLASVITPKDFEIRRIYTEDFPLTFASSGRRRPEARKAIIDQVNSGTLILNYAGHGNPKVWAHEAILTLEDVKTQFTNADRLMFIVAATCDWGRFDEGTEQSSAEEAVVNKNGGAIGVLSATRAVYAHSNAETNQKFYLNMFSGAKTLRLGDALLLTKNSLFDLQNKQKYFLLGDPTLRLAVPSARVTVDSINGNSVTVADTLRALEKVTLTATVRDTANGIDGNYSGAALITVFDSERIRVIPTIPAVPYQQPGSVIYKGEASIVNGKLSATFIVPKDIAYENKNGRISVYFSNAAGDGRGYTTNFIVGGTNANAPVDSVGPTIDIYFDSPSFRSGDLVGNNPTLIVELKDSSGINSSGSAIGHRIEAWIDNSSKSIDLTDSYKGKTDSYQAGTVEYQLEGLSTGSHSIKVKAWDAYNNSSITETYFSVASSDGLTIQQLYNFPNPVSTTTAFTFRHNQQMPIDVTINIYTVAGRLIHRIERFAVTDRFVSIPWDRRDSDGDAVGNGVYFYKVIAKTIDGRYTSESIGKLAVVR